MKCNECRKFLAEYSDGEVNQKVHRTIEAHVSECPSCKRELELLMQVAVLPFRRAEREVPSPEVWKRIKATIASRGGSEGSSDRVVWLNNLFSLKNIKYLAVAASIVVLISVVALQRQITTRRTINEYLTEEAYFLAELAETEAESSLELEESDFGTELEYYFLS
ncbi:MAG: zf-HC2 domain-containing protein [Candidatus Omnitrophica bacterium]|nr:zf-HC2 domain-containing protein [Candidatus Omnitrophota bacterium]